MTKNFEIPPLTSDFKLNEWEVKRQLQNASSIFYDPVKGYKQDLIAQSLIIFEKVKKWAEQTNFTEHENQALWGLYLCYSRMERHQEAVDALQALRKNIEAAREQIVDPYQRAGVLIEYQYLFPALCKQLYQLNQYTELLDAIEGAKGRALADVLTKRERQPESDKQFAAPIQQLLQSVQEVSFHYLTYLMDDEETFAVLVAKDGSIHAQFIENGKTQLEHWLKDDSKDYNPINPCNWGKTREEGGKKANLGAKKKGNFVINLSENLANLVSWLEPFFEKGVLQEGDHICYCPDEYLHLIPLHYLPFYGKKLVQFFSISRIHSAAALMKIFERNNIRPDRFTAIHVWSKDDLGQSQADSFGRVTQWLKQKMPSWQILANEEANLKAVAKLPFEQRLIHFATHGIFPNSKNGKDNPYKVSGLALSNESGQIPENQNGEGGSLLTPECVYKQKLNFWGSHVTLQACVSGLAKEGIGGDALGLEWAFLLAGASSLLSTHWFVDVGGAASFSQKFYQRWLFEDNEDNSRAVAWRKTVLELIENPTKRRPDDWAAFSLSGDWR